MSVQEGIKLKSRSHGITEKMKNNFECKSGKYINYASDNNIPELWIPIVKTVQ